MKAIAVDFGGTHIGCGVVDDARLLAQSSIPFVAESGIASALPVVAETLQKLLKQAGVEARSCIGIAISFPGIVDVRTNAILTTLKKYEDAPTVDLAGWAHDVFGLPIRIETDSRQALLGEHYAGSAQKTDSFVMITLGTGIGTAAMIGGRLLRGAHGHAGCLGGHFSVDIYGARCLCGNLGCAESEAAGRSIALVARRFPGYSESPLARFNQLQFRELFKYADQGDPVAVAVRTHCLDVWSATAVALTHAYDPEIVVIGGGIMQSAEAIIPHVQGYIDNHVWASWGRPKIVAAQAGIFAAILGAVPLLMENLDNIVI